MSVFSENWIKYWEENYKEANMTTYGAIDPAWSGSTTFTGCTIHDSENIPLSGGHYDQVWVDDIERTVSGIHKNTTVHNCAFHELLDEFKALLGKF